jgi:hypothetical protein
VYVGITVSGADVKKKEHFFQVKESWKARKNVHAVPPQYTSASKAELIV